MFRYRHFSNIDRQVNVGSARFFVFGIFKGQTDDLTDGIRADHHFGTFGDRLKHLGQIQKLMGSDVHTFRTYLSGDGNQRCAVTVSVCNAGDQVGGARSQG